MNMPLKGYRVVDWTQWQAGPGASMMLGDFGAEVIKIEDRITGDPARGVLHVFDEWKVRGNGEENVQEAYFECSNRNKKGMALDLHKEQGRAIIHRLVKKSDVFITNFRESAASNYGLDYRTLSQLNPKLIYASVSGYGSNGPDADIRSYDVLGMARAGLLFASDTEEPHYPVGGLADAETGIMTAFGVAMALLTRERQGIGQKVEASLLSSMLFQQWVALGFKFIGNEMWLPIPRDRAANPLGNSYKCSDGKWIFLCHPQADRFWPNVCKALGIEEKQNDPKFENMLKRRQNNAELIGIMDKVFATKTCEAWVKILQENECICERVNHLDDLLTDPQVLANDYLPEFDHPAYGKVRYAPMPFKLSKTPGSVRLPAPEFGQHTEEIMTEVLGYSWDEVSRLKEAQVI